tara:strand:- start:420 stop:605 length:186 start_codon:yes stop_codon:yes gene_type:complete
MRIVNDTGMGRGTRVYNNDGAEMHDIIDVTIDPIIANQLITATIKIHVKSLDVKIKASQDE